MPYYLAIVIQMKSIPFIFIISIIVVVLNVYSPLVHPQLINGQSDGRIPVLLIHGYHSGPEVCDDWLNKFHNDCFIAEADYFHRQ